jgi:hypothetical protein
MLDVHLPDVARCDTAIRSSRRLLALSRAVCAETKVQVAKSRRLIEQSRRLLAQTQAGNRHPDRAVRSTGMQIQGIGPRHAVIGGSRSPPSELSRCGKGGPSSVPSRGPGHDGQTQHFMQPDSTQRHWWTRPLEIAFHTASLLLIVSLYLAVALGVWEAWRALSVHF